MPRRRLGDDDNPTYPGAVEGYEHEVYEPLVFTIDDAPGWS